MQDGSDNITHPTEQEKQVETESSPSLLDSLKDFGFVLFSPVKKGWDWSARWLRWVPLSWQGLWVLLIGGFLAIRYGSQQADWILMILGLFSCFLVLISMLMVGGATFYFRWRIKKLNPRESIARITTEIQKPVKSGFLLPQPLIPLLDFRSEWLSPEAEISVSRASLAFSEQATFSKRGLYSRIHRKMILQDLFGLASVSWTMEEEREVLILPRLNRFRLPAVQSLVEDDGHYVPGYARVGDRVDTRAYMPGDPIRFIHWKLFARTQEPIIRIQESSAAFAHRIIAYFISDPKDQMASEIARFSLDSNSLGQDWAFGADGSGAAASSLHQAHQLLAASGEAQDACGRGLAAFLKTVGFNDKEHRLILFASEHVGYWFHNVEDTLAQYAHACTLVLSGNYKGSPAPEQHASTENLPNKDSEAVAVKPGKERPFQWSKLFFTVPFERRVEHASARAGLAALADAGLRIEATMPSETMEFSAVHPVQRGIAPPATQRPGGGL